MTPDKVINFWPYCPKCREPFVFATDEPFAFCRCGTTEWGYPRPAEWIPDPRKITELCKKAADHLEEHYRTPRELIAELRRVGSTPHEAGFDVQKAIARFNAGIAKKS